MYESAATYLHQQLSDISMDMDVTPELLKFEAKQQVASQNHIKDEPTPELEEKEEDRFPSTEVSPKEDEAIRLAAPVKLVKGFFSFRKKKTVDVVPVKVNEPIVVLVAPLSVKVPPKEPKDKETLKDETLIQEQEPSDLAAPIDIKKKKRSFFRSFRRSKSKNAPTVEQEDSTGKAPKQETHTIEDTSNDVLQQYVAEIGVSPSQAERECVEKSQEKGSFWAELVHFPISIFQTIQEDTPRTGDDSEFVLLGLCLTFPQFIGQFIESDVQGLQAVGEGIKAEFNKEEEIAKFQNDLLHLNPTDVDEGNDSNGQEIEQTETVDDHELEQEDTLEEQEVEPTETMKSGYSNKQEIDQAETVEDQECEQVDTMDEQGIEQAKTIESEYEEEECAGEGVELSAARTEENEETEVGSIKQVE